MKMSFEQSLFIKSENERERQALPSREMIELLHKMTLIILLTVGEEGWVSQHILEINFKHLLQILPA